MQNQNGFMQDLACRAMPVTSKPRSGSLGMAIQARGAKFRMIVCSWHTYSLPAGGFSDGPRVLGCRSSDPQEKPLRRTLGYLFDPLGGWYYGASAAVAALAGSDAVDLKRHRGPFRSSSLPRRLTASPFTNPSQE